MSRFAVLATLAVAALMVCVFVSTAAAHPASSSGSWVPGSPYMIEETDASDLLEHTVDHAYCTGIPRFGHSGEFPSETFVVFDCDWSIGGKTSMYCSDARYKAVKASQRGYFKLRDINKPDCI